MKNVMVLLFAGIFLASCNNDTKMGGSRSESTPVSNGDSSLKLPYKANYSSQWNDKVSDKDLQMVINSYKYWQDGDMKAVAGTLSDSIDFNGWDGTSLNVTRDSLSHIWGKHRDSIGTVNIKMATWSRMHNTEKNDDIVTVWYDETDTYKNGTVDSARYADINMVKNGKIVWFSQYKQSMKKP